MLFMKPLAFMPQTDQKVRKRLKHKEGSKKKAMQRHDNRNVCLCVCYAFQLLVNSVTVCNCHERRWSIENGTQLGRIVRTCDNLVCLTVTCQDRTFSGSGKRFRCLYMSSRFLHDKSYRCSGFRVQRKELSPVSQMQWVDRCPKNCY